MENNFFDVNDQATFEDGFWKWLFYWINHPGKCPALEKTAKGIIDRMLGDKRPPIYSSIEIIPCPKVRMLFLINETIALALNNRSLTVRRRTELFNLRKELTNGTLPGIEHSIEPKDIHVVYAEFVLPTYSIRKSLLQNENVSLSQQVESMQKKLGTDSDQEQERADIEFYMRNPVNSIISFHDMMDLLTMEADNIDDTIYLSHFQHQQTIRQISEQWKGFPPAQWNTESARGFGSFLEKNRPEIAWGLSEENTLFIHYDFCLVSDEYVDLAQVIHGIYMDFCGNIGTDEWECQFSVSKRQKNLPIPILWNVYYQMRKQFESRNIDCYKKRFLSRNTIPVIAVSMNRDHYIEFLNELDRLLYQIDWAEMENCLKIDVVSGLSPSQKNGHQK